MVASDARAWLDAVEAALVAPRLDRLEALRRETPAAGALLGLDEAVARVVQRVAALTGRSATDHSGARLGWWLDALLLQPVIVVPRSRGRALAPVLFLALTALLGLLVGRIAAAAIMAAGLVGWALSAGGAVRERHEHWLRLGDTIFDLRHVRPEPLGDDWYLLRGRRVPAGVLVDLGVVPRQPPRA